MRILLDGRPLQYAGPDREKSRLILDAAAALAAEGVEWISVVDHRYRPELLPGLPGEVRVRRSLPGRAGWKLWYDRSIPRLARREGADRLMLTAGVAAADCGLPQYVWMPERAGSSGKTGAWCHPSIYARRLKTSLDRAATVFCFSERDRQLLGGDAPELRAKMAVLGGFAAEGIHPLSAAEKEALRSERLGGKEFFFADLTGGEAEGVVDLLKAFSFFKKRQHSRMRLLLGGKMTGPVAAIKDRIRSYKYREDVDWCQDLGTDSALLAGAAYAAIFPFDGHGLGETLLGTWKAGVPAIVVDGGLLQEISGDAAPGMVSGDPASLAAQLMRIYKDEDLRTALIGKGLDRLKMYDRGRFLRTVREAIGGKAVLPPGEGAP